MHINLHPRNVVTIHMGAFELIQLMKDKIVNKLILVSKFIFMN